MKWCVIVLCLLNTSCASYWVYSTNKKEAIASRVIASGDDRLIKAYQVADGAGLGINVTAGEIVWSNLPEQVLAALVDAALLYGSYEALRWLRNEADDAKDAPSVKAEPPTPIIRIETENDRQTITIGSRWPENR